MVLVRTSKVSTWYLKYQYKVKLVQPAPNLEVITLIEKSLHINLTAFLCSLSILLIQTTQEYSNMDCTKEGYSIYRLHLLDIVSSYAAEMLKSYYNFALLHTKLM